MNNDDFKLIETTIQHYINGARSGKGNDMKPAFHKDATIFGYIGTDLFAGPIQKLFDCYNLLTARYTVFGFKH